MKIKEFQHQPVKPDTYEASMALNQLMRIGKHAIKLHNMIDDAAEMESWVAKKIDLAGDYVKKVYNYTEGEKAGLYDDDGMSEMKKMPKGTGTMYGVKESREEIGDYAREIESGRIVRIVDFTPDEDGDIYTISYGEDQGEMDVLAKSLKFLDQTGVDQEEISKFDEDAGSLTDEQKKGLQMIHKKYDGYFGNNMDPLVLGYMKYRLSTGVGTDGIEEKELEAALKKYGYDTMYDAEQADDDFYDKINNKEHLPITTAMKSDLDKVMGSDFNDDGKLEMASEYLQNMDESVSEDAGEGHMSKSTLYHTAKYAIALMDMIKPGDDLEGWVQSKLNKAADYLQGVYNYEEYQKLNPYREELDSSLMQKHAQVVQKNIDEILAKETKIDDIDTKPGMMRILAKRVNEVEKEIAKETRKQSETQTDESGILYRAGVKKYGKAGMKAIQSAAGKGASHQEIGKIKDKHLKDAEDLEEGLKDWAKKTAMAGVIVAGLAGVNSINNAIDNSIPAIDAMNTALEMAQDSGNDELAKMIEKDLSDAKIRLNSGKDLSYVVDLQNKYAKFIKSESLAYESKLGLMLNQQLK